MNSFKKLVIKILCCAIVCTAIIPDVYGMKRKADDDQSSAKRNVRARTDATEALRDSADRRQRAVEPETEVPASQPAQQPEQEMDTSSTPDQPVSDEASGKDAKSEAKPEERSGKDEKILPTQSSSNGMSLSDGYQDQNLAKPKTQSEEVLSLDDDDVFQYARHASLQSLDEDEARRAGNASQSSNSSNSNSSSSSSRQFETKAPAQDAKMQDEPEDVTESTKVTIKTVDGKHSVQIPVSWFDESLVINANVREERKEAVENLKIIFKDQQELETFKQMLSLLNDSKNKGLVSRQRAKIIADKLKDITMEIAGKMMAVSERLQSSTLSLACAMYIANHFVNLRIYNRGIYVDQSYLFDDYQSPFKDFIAREIRFIKRSETDDDLKHLAAHGFLPEGVSLKDCPYDSDEEQEANEQQILAKKLFKSLSQDPLRDEFIKQLPRSVIELLIIENCTTPGFMVSDWIIGLTPAQEIRDIIYSGMRTYLYTFGEVDRLVSKLDKKAKAFVGIKQTDTKEVEKIKNRFAKLPENYFKMEVRRVFHAVYGVTLDDISPAFLERISFSFTGLGADRTDLSSCNIQTLDLYTDFLLVFDRMHPIEWLLLDHNQISDIKGLVNILVKLKNLNGLSLDRNKITCIEGLNALVHLTNLDLSYNQIACIEGLNALVHLTSLELSYNKISRIEGLDQLVNLHRLDLNHNDITRIKGLDALVNLGWLWLNHNEITRIEGLNSLVHLTILDLDYNPITRIEGINALVNLEKLYFASNPEFANQPDFDAIVQALRNRNVHVGIDEN